MPNENKYNTRSRSKHREDQDESLDNLDWQNIDPKNLTSDQRKFLNLPSAGAKLDKDIPADTNQTRQNFEEKQREFDRLRHEEERRQREEERLRREQEDQQREEDRLRREQEDRQREEDQLRREQEDRQREAGQQENADLNREIVNLNRELVPNMQPINVIMSPSIKYAVEAVPYFTGENIPLSHFIDGCNEAHAMIPANEEQNLVFMLRNKLRGEARRTIQGLQFETINDFLSHLKELYEPPKSLYQLQGEMGRIFQRDDESTLSYTNRARELGNQILDVIEAQLPVGQALSDADKARYGNEFKSCLIRGLKPEIEQKISRDKNFQNTLFEAVVIEKELRAKDLLRGKISSKRDINYSNRAYTYDVPNNREGRRVTVVQGQPIVCQICNKAGHSALACYQLEFNRNKSNQERFSSNIDNNGSRYNSNNNNNNSRFRGSDQINSRFNNRYRDNNQPNYNRYNDNNTDRRDNSHIANYRNNNQYNGNNDGNMDSSSRNAFNNPSFSREPVNGNIDEKICYYCKSPGHFMADCTKRRNYNQAFTDRPPGPSSDGRARINEERSGNYTPPPRQGATREVGRSERPVLQVVAEEMEPEENTEMFQWQ
ncbi:probable E3 ubiquitin-protein ligase bre1 [Microplitis mediator]|uniref:probable E3 ubiquitin-protein ligase bre1 n=1 Tax=Microplitis mediator TaxID=375433 RepID=UPI0025529A28|nr:probable E3 ubiquitin-protein ligase bre1 [Microplitis mediator]